MRKPGGFRRCRVILANHPELYPLNNICAWLHHETTGLWPNEGCHHPGMKNCRGKLKKRNWTNAQFARHLRSAAKRTVKKKQYEDVLEDVFFHDVSIYEFEQKSAEVVTESDYDHAVMVLKDFMEMEEDFVKYLRDDENWEIEGEDEKGNKKSVSVSPLRKMSECCGDEMIEKK